MAEGMLGGILGGGEEKPELEAPEALAGAEAFAAAVAAKLAGSDPDVARDTSEFLKKQAQLLETQNNHLNEEHALRVAHLRNQLRNQPRPTARNRRQPATGRNQGITAA